MGDVMRGTAQTIAQFRPLIYVENDRVEKSAELIELLLKHNYELYWHTPALFNRDNFAGDPENVFGMIVSINMLCFPAESKPNAEGFRRITSPADRYDAIAAVSRSSHLSA
jgi:hypothetical protein